MFEWYIGEVKVYALHEEICGDEYLFVGVFKDGTIITNTIF
jgi:hypothetical protein